MIKIIENNNVIYAKIIRASYSPSEAEFFTDKNDKIQFGLINYKKGHKTGAHYHNLSEIEAKQTDEILMFQKGTARIDFYDNQGSYIKSCEVFEGDIVILYQGGHNLIYQEDSTIFIIKPGAYDEQQDKIRIIGANNLELKIEN